METTLATSETTLDRASGAMTIAQPSSVFDTVPDLAIYKSRWLQRCLHYGVLRSYYHGTFYDDRPDLRKALKLYSGIRQIFGPLRRAVRVDVAKVPGGWSLLEDAPANLMAAVDQVRTWSRYRKTYSQAVLHGASVGEFGLLVVDNRLARTVTICPLRPDEVVLGTLASGMPFGLVVKSRLVDRGGVYEYAQLITPNQILTYRNGLPHDYGGGASRSNLQRRVPLLLSPYLAGESGIGEPAFAGTQELLDRVNDAASQTLDVIQRNAEALVVFSGVSDVDFNPENNAITLPSADAKAYTLVPNLVIDQALLVIDKVLSEFKNLLPQLVFDDIRGGSDVAYDTVLTYCSELIDHVNDARTHVDEAFETAERWAIEAAQGMGLFPGVNAAQHRLDPERPVIAPTPGQRMALESQSLGVEGVRKALTQPQPQQQSTNENTEEES